MENFDIKRFFNIFLTNKIIIMLIVLVSLAIGYFYSFYYVKPMYLSSATVVLVQNNEEEDLQSSSITQSDITLNRNLLATYTKIAKSNKVLEQVIQNLELNMTVSELAGLVSVQAVNSTDVFKISVSNQDNELASIIANELLSVFSEEVSSLYHMNNVYAMDHAEVSSTPYNINHKKDLLLSVFAGCILSFGFAFIVYLIDNTIKSENDVEQYSNLSVLSSIPTYEKKKGINQTELIVDEQPKSPISECFKSLRTNIMFSIENSKSNIILVTSSSMGEGKSFISSNLAITFAQSGKKVILVDTDMRKGRIHKMFNLSSHLGLSNCLANLQSNDKNVNINEYIQETNIENLHIMTSGDVPPNPSELLSSYKTSQFLEALNTQYDVVICDGTPCTLVSDSIILSKLVDTTILVTSYKATKIDTLTRIQKSIEIVGGKIGGVIINKLELGAKAYQNNYYYGENKDIHINSEHNCLNHDPILDTYLCISDATPIIDEKEDILNNDVSYNDTSNEIKILTNTLHSNKEELHELKDLYKTLMQNTLAITTQSTNNDFSSFINEWDEIKQEYASSLLTQKQQFELLNSKIEDIKNSDISAQILSELAYIQSSYQSTVQEYHEQISVLNAKINDLNESTLSPLLLEQLNDMKKNYSDTIHLHNEQIHHLNESIMNISIPDNNVDSILEELKIVKEVYENTFTTQNEQISELVEKIKNISDDDTSNILMDKIETIQSQYEILSENQDKRMNYLMQKVDTIDYSEKFDLQNKQIDELVEKIKDISYDDTSNILMDKIETIQSQYEILSENQDKKMDYLIQKVENSSLPQEEIYNLHTSIEHMRNSYSSALELQDRQINHLNEKINAVSVESNLEVLQQIKLIHELLESMNHKFQSLEQATEKHEFLIKELKQNSKQTIEPSTKKLDINKLNDKVIQIQDYLEHNDTIKLKNISDAEMDLIDELIEVNTNIENTTQNEEINSFKESATSSYENSTKKKESNKRGFSIFKSKIHQPEEEPITIVSQILLKSTENVG